MLKKFYANKKVMPVLALSVSYILGCVIYFAFGACQLMLVTSVSFSAAVTAAVLPFLLGDFIKTALAVLTMLPFYGKIGDMRSDLIKR